MAVCSSPRDRPSRPSGAARVGPGRHGFRTVGTVASRVSPDVREPNSRHARIKLPASSSGSRTGPVRRENGSGRPHGRDDRGRGDLPCPRGRSGGARPTARSRAAGLARTLLVGDAITVGLAFAVVATVATFVSDAAAASLMVPPIAAVLGLLGHPLARASGSPPHRRPLDRARRPRPGRRPDRRRRAAGRPGPRPVVSVALATAATVVTWLALVAWRSMYRSWLSIERSAGRYVQRTLVVGTGRGRWSSSASPRSTPRPAARRRHRRHPRRGRRRRPRRPLARRDRRPRPRSSPPPPSPASSSAPPTSPRRRSSTLIRSERDGGAEVVIHAGLPGVDANRVTVSAFANEALLHVEPATPSRPALAVKRLFDIVVAGAILLVAVPGPRPHRRPRQAGGRRPGPVPPAAGRSGRRRVRDAQVPHDGRRRRGPAGRRAGRQPALRPAVQAGPRPPGHPGSATSCAAPASTSCRS